jgi:1-acyl-sn-glycerol-3-phosphate acyltransferase
MGLIRDLRQVFRGRDWRGRSRVPRSAVAYEEPERRTPFATGWARTPTASAIRLGLQRGVLKPLAWSQTRAEVGGLDHLESLRGPAVFVANHASHLDAPLVVGSLPRRIARRLAIGAAADYFFDSRLRALVTTLVFNAFPVERFGGNRARSLAPVLLHRGWNLLLFPESSRSTDGWMSAFRLGAAQLCCQRGVPAVPVALRGTYGAMPRGRTWPVPGRRRVVVRYGRPLWPDAGESAREFNVRLSTAVARLWAEEELGWYKALRAEPTEAVDSTRGPKVASWRRMWESTRPL